MEKPAPPLALCCLNGCASTACDEAAAGNFVQQRIHLHQGKRTLAKQMIWQQTTAWTLWGEPSQLVLTHFSLALVVLASTLFSQVGNHWKRYCTNFPSMLDLMPSVKPLVSFCMDGTQLHTSVTNYNQWHWFWLDKWNMLAWKILQWRALKLNKGLQLQFSMPAVHKLWITFIDYRRAKYVCCMYTSKTKIYRVAPHYTLTDLCPVHACLAGSHGSIRRAHYGAEALNEAVMNVDDSK